LHNCPTYQTNLAWQDYIHFYLLLDILMFQTEFNIQCNQNCIHHHQVRQIGWINKSDIVSNFLLKLLDFQTGQLYDFLQQRIKHQTCSYKQSFTSVDSNSIFPQKFVILFKKDYFCFHFHVDSINTSNQQISNICMAH